MISNTIFCNPFQMSWVSHGFIWPCKSFVFSRSLWLKHKTLQSVPCLLNRAAFRVNFAILWKWIKATFFGRGWSIRGNWPDPKTSMTGQHKLLVPGKFKVSLSKYLWSHLTTFEASNFFITLHEDCAQNIPRQAYPWYTLWNNQFLPSEASRKNREYVLKWIDRKSLFLSGKVIREHT